MGSGKQSAAVPAQLDRLRDRLEGWRATRQTRRIPETLWRSAADLAAELGVHRTARALRLNYDYLKRRTKSQGRRRGGDAPAPGPAFVELVRSEAGGSEGVAELEGSGGRMRVEWRGAVPDLAALSRSFFRGEDA